METNAPLYARVMGPAFDELPPPLRELHNPNGVTVWSGTAKVIRGTGLLAKIAAILLRLPRASDNTAVTVTFTPVKGTEIW